VTVEIELTLEQDIRNGQIDDEKIKEIKELIKLGKAPGFREDSEGFVWHGNRICVPNIKSVRELILKEAHEIAYSINPGSEKMYQDLKQKFWWYGIKRHVAEYVALCDVCKKVKAEHQKPTGLLQPLKISEWKWEEIGIDFIVGLPRTQSDFDSIWVVVDRFTKLAHFIPVKTTYTGAKLAEIYMSRIVSYHPQTDDQTERTNQILEDIMEPAGIKACRMPNFLTTTVIRLVSRCRIFKLCTTEDAERRYIGISPSRDYRRCRTTSADGEGKFEDCPDKIMQIIAIGILNLQWEIIFKVKGKLAPRYIGPFKIVDRMGEVAYQLELPDGLSGVHDVFHVSQLKKCLRVPEEQLQMDDLNVQDDLTYTEYPVQILETAERVTRKRVIKMCKVKWSHHSAEEAT
ncbi:hypothetical protein U9M48_003037, partial [Paspalum notatum var. saurae]